MKVESSCEQMDRVDARDEEISHNDSSDDDRSCDDRLGKAINGDLKLAQELTGR